MADVPIHSITDTWNSGVTVYYGIKMDVTNTSSAANSKLFAMQISSANVFDIDKSGDVTLTSVDAGAAAGPNLTLYRNSATPAASDVIGKVLFQGEDSAGNTQDYAEILVSIIDPTSGSEDANLGFRNVVAGTMTTQATITATGWNSMNIGATTPGTGAFTTLSATGAVTLTTALTVANGGTGAATFTAGFVYGSGTTALATRVMTGTANEITVANGDGSGVPTWSLPTALTFTGKTVTGGTFSGPTISGSPSAAGATWSNLGAVTTVDINGGTVDGVVIGGASAAAGSFTTLSATGTSTLVAANLTGNLAISKATPAITLTSTGTGSVSTITENSTGITYAADTANAVASSFHIFTVDGSQKFAVGASAATFSSGVSLTASGGGALTGTWTNLGTVTTIDINGGTIDGTVIGGASAAAGTFTTLNSTGGALNGTIGGTTPNAGTFTTVGASNSIQAGTWASNGATQGILLSAPGGVFSSVTGTGASTHYTFANANSTVGTISTNGSATTYATSSDYRLKTDVSDFLDSGAMIDALRPVSYLWKADNAPGVGFIAHEVQEVFSDAITGEKDGETMQGGDWSKLVPILVAELKSLRARVAELEAA